MNVRSKKESMKKRAGECIEKKLCTESAIERCFRAALIPERIGLSTETASGGHKRAALALESMGLSTEMATGGHKRAALDRG